MIGITVYVCIVYLAQRLAVKSNDPDSKPMDIGPQPCQLVAHGEAFATQYHHIRKM